jgi:4-amino-4-deoxy-L-arabinose transferase-like glycosyltransferase
MKPALSQYFDRIAISMLAILCYALFFFGLGGIGLVGPDEPRYASIAREMLRTGDYITPRLYGLPWFEKPPLMYWIAAVGYKIFGNTEAAARFPSAAAATACVFLIYCIGRKLWSRETGLLSALTAATSIGSFAFARAASMDMLLSACLTMGLASFLFALNDPVSRRHLWFFLFYAALGLGVLTKGPVAILLPILSLAGFLLLRGRWQEWRSWHPESLWITAAVAAPWYVLCTMRNGWQFIQVFFVNQNLERFTSTIHGHIRPVYFFIPVLLLLMFPWTFLLISAFRRTFGKNDHILIWWAIIPFVFFSLSGSKLPGYILPVVPPLSLLLGKELLQPSSRVYRLAVLIEAGTMVFIGVAFGFFGNMLNVDPHVSGSSIVTVTFVAAAVLTVIALWLQPLWLAAFNGTIMVALVITAATLVFPRFDVTDTMRPWQSALAQIIPPDDMILLYKPERWAEYGMQYYRPDRIRTVFSPEELADATKAGGRLLCISDDKALPEVTGVSSVDLQIVHTIGNHTAFWVWQVKRGS